MAVHLILTIQIAEKIITVNVKALTNNIMSEINFPSLDAALADGYTVKQIVPIPFTSVATVGVTTIVFVLEKKQRTGL
ncbi:hypothetical protein AXW84_18440 [Hymenobacter sp. PAMC 26628]|nr:hypothetical protein AXW84_18440 [Hymenobacter sp. PAMC 26628]